MSRSTLLALCLTFAAGPRTAWAWCELEGDLVGVAPAGVVDGIPFVVPVFDDAVTTGCGDPAAITPVVPDPDAAVVVAGAPWLRIGERHRVRLEAGATLGTHAVVARLVPTGTGGGTGARVPAATPVSGIRKSGNNVPRCTQGRWRPASFPLPLEVQRDASDDLAAAAGLAEVRAAAAEWASPACSAASFAVSTELDAAPPLDPDGRNTLAWLESGSTIFDNLGPENLAFTCYVCDDDGYFIEADVRLDGARHTWSDSCDGVAFDIRGAALHELGHVLGVDHAEAPDSVMYPVTSARRLLATRTLAREDALATCGLYPCPSDTDCSGPSEEATACPAGGGLCAPCEANEGCGAASDLCLQSTETGERSCGRACSPSFPCPSGYECANVGAADLQCVPIAGACEGRGFVGCPCEHDDECGLEGDRCLPEGVCGASCEGGVACPDRTACVMVLDGSGLPLARQCVADEGFRPRCGARPRSGRGCSAAAAGGNPFLAWPAIVGLALAASVVRNRSPR